MGGFRFSGGAQFNSQPGVVFVFQCYLDDSDNHLGPTLGIAG